MPYTRENTPEKRFKFAFYRIALSVYEAKTGPILFPRWLSSGTVVNYTIQLVRLRSDILSSILEIRTGTFVSSTHQSAKRLTITVTITHKKNSRTYSSIVGKKSVAKIFGDWKYRKCLKHVGQYIVRVALRCA